MIQQETWEKVRLGLEAPGWQGQQMFSSKGRGVEVHPARHHMCDGQDGECRKVTAWLSFAWEETSLGVDTSEIMSTNGAHFQAAGHLTEFSLLEPPPLFPQGGRKCTPVPIVPRGSQSHLGRTPECRTQAPGSSAGHLAITGPLLGP